MQRALSCPFPRLPLYWQVNELYIQDLSPSAPRHHDKTEEGTIHYMRTSELFRPALPSHYLTVLHENSISNFLSFFRSGYGGGKGPPPPPRINTQPVLGKLGYTTPRRFRMDCFLVGLRV